MIYVKGKQEIKQAIDSLKKIKITQCKLGLQQVHSITLKLHIRKGKDQCAAQDAQILNIFCNHITSGYIDDTL